jgi:hypothetical protein
LIIKLTPFFEQNKTFFMQASPVVLTSDLDPKGAKALPKTYVGFLSAA